MKKTHHIVLVGNTNVGKTTFLNTIAGVFQETGNYPGTTVEIFKTHTEIEKKEFEIIDLPGTYSLNPYTEEEKVTRDFLLKEKYDLIVQIIDPKATKRSLNFTLELMELGQPIFLVFNESNQKCPRKKNLLDQIENKLGIHGIVINASEKDTKNVFYKALSHLPKKMSKKAKEIPQKIKAGIKEDNEKYALKIKQNRYRFLEKEFSGFFANREVLPPCVSHKLDKFLLNKFIGIPIFFFLIWIVFQATFKLGTIPMGWIDTLFSLIQSKLTISLPSNLWSSVLVDGVIGGVGATIIFLPNIIILLFFLAILKQSGYLARTAYLLDYYMSKIGLEGRSVVPLLMGFGCNVPAIMATRTLSSQKKRIVTSMMIPFMSCGARLPIFTLFIAAFFEEKWRGTILFGLYLFGVLMSTISGLIFNKMVKDRNRPLLLELPNYRLPKIKNLFLEVWFSIKAFLMKAGKVILPFSILLWVLFTFPQNTTIEDSYAASVGKTIAPVFEPLGFDWKITTGLIAGLGAKEIVISTFGTLSSLEEGNDLGLILALKNDPVFTPVTVMAFLVFVLLYTPCIAVLGIFKQEFGIKWMFVALLYPTLFAWIMAFLVHQIGSLLIN